MGGSFLPPVKGIQYHNNSVRKDAKSLPEPVKRRYREFLNALYSGQLPRTGKNISQIGFVKKYRLDGRYRVAFAVQGRTAVILAIGDHPKMERFTEKIEKETRKHRKSGYTPFQ